MAADESLQRTTYSSGARAVAPTSLHYLTVVDVGGVVGAAIERSLLITGEPYVLGRDVSREFALVDEEVSRNHCTVRLEHGVVLVRDLDSTNGTFIDGRHATEERELPPSSVMQLGKHVLRHVLRSPAQVARAAELSSDLARARHYVEGLLPREDRAGRIVFDRCFEPSSILGGDALGHHQLSDGRLALYVLDVCGHGVGSTMHAAAVLTALRSESLGDADFGDPASVLTALNAAFTMERHSGMYCTLWYGVLDPVNGGLEFAAAGHPPALVVAAHGSVRERLAVKNTPIGMVEGRVIATGNAHLEAGDRLAVFTDGVFEVVDAGGVNRTLDDFEVALTSGLANGSFEGAAARIHGVVRANAGEGLQDDFTLLLVGYDGP